MTRYRFDETERLQIIKKFEEALEPHGLAFVNEVNVAPVSKVGVPPPFSLMNNAIRSPGRLTIYFRIMLVVLSIFFMLLTFNRNLLLYVSLFTISIAYLWLDFVIIYLEKERQKVPVTWFVLSLAIILFLAFVLGPIFETIYSNVLLLEPSRSGELILLFGVYIVGISFFTAFGTYRLYANIVYFERMLFEDQYVAVRRHIRTLSMVSLFGGVNDPSGDALSAEGQSTILKLVVSAMVPVFLSYIWQYVFPVPIDAFLILVCSSSVIGLIVFTAMVIRYVRRERMIIRTALTSQVIMLSLLAIPISLLQPSLIWIGLFYMEGILLLFVVWQAAKKTASSNPELLGQFYFERFLATLRPDEALDFVDKVLYKLELFYPSGE